MGAIPDRDTPLCARSDADFVARFERYADEAYTQPFDLAGWKLRFVVKRSALDDTAMLAVEDEAIERDGHAFTVRIDRADLHAALRDGERRVDATHALQAEGPNGEDEVWVAGPFEMSRGL